MKYRRKRKPNYTDRMIDACKEMLVDKRIGYNIPISYYEDKYNLKKNQKEEER